MPTIYSTYLLRHLRHVIGQNIHRQRSQRKLTIHKLSLRTGIPEWLLDHYELGKSNITLEAILRIACIPEVTVGELVHDGRSSAV